MSDKKKTLRERFDGWKTHITVTIGILSAFSAWLDGTIGLPALGAAILGGLAISFSRAGTAKAQKSVDAINGK